MVSFQNALQSTERAIDQAIDQGEQLLSAATGASVDLDQIRDLNHAAEDILEALGTKPGQGQISIGEALGNAVDNLQSLYPPASGVFARSVGDLALAAHGFIHSQQPSLSVAQHVEGIVEDCLLLLGNADDYLKAGPGQRAVLEQAGRVVLQDMQFHVQDIAMQLI